MNYKQIKGDFMNEIIKKSDVVYSQSNNFIESRFSNFTLIELKIIELLAAQTNNKDKTLIAKKQNKFIKIKLIDLANLISADRKNMYVIAKNLAIELSKKQAEFKYIDSKGNPAYRVSNFFNNITYENNTFEFELNYSVLIYFINLKQYFTKINLKYITALNSIYAIKLYKLLKQFQSIQSRTFTVQNLREFLCLEQKHKQFSDMRKKVIDLAVNQINQSTDLNITYEEQKQGRITHKIVFYITP